MAPQRLVPLGALLLACVVVLGSACSPELVDKIPTISGGRSKTIVSADGAFTMKIPTSWTKDPSLNDVAVLQAADRTKEAYALLIAQPKAPFGGKNLDQFADEQVQVFLQSVTEANTQGPSQVLIDDKDSLQYEIAGKVNNVDVIYLYTFLESPDQFMKVLTWSLKAKFESNRDILESVTNSTRQVKQLGEEPPSGSEGESSEESDTAPASPEPSPGESPVEDASVVR